MDFKLPEELKMVQTLARFRERPAVTSGTEVLGEV
jgi:hypothetical protein